MKLLNNDGSYNYNTFKGERGTWRLIGVKCHVNHTNPLLCMDTFKSNTGEYMDVKREKVFEQMALGKIHPVEDSLIKIPNLSQKEWSKKVGRNI